MADPQPTRVMADPPIAAWRLGEGSATHRSDRAALAPLLDTFGLHRTPFDPTRPIIATGHQAAFWHPGILAKDIAMAVACARLGAQPVHLVVDHDNNPAQTLRLPVRSGGALSAELLVLGQDDPATRTGERPPIDDAGLQQAVARFRARIDGEVAVDLGPLLTPLPKGAEPANLADSITLRQLRWMRPVAGEVLVLRTSRLARLGAFEQLVQRMLGDARRCVSAYNQAVAAVPEAGVAPLAVERDRVELPLWFLADASAGGGRHRVFADLADRTPILTQADGTPIQRLALERGGHFPLAPKALLLTAFLRAVLCDLFIHGTGGGMYERVTERWWNAWGGTPLAPLAVVSADVYLETDVPVATPADVERAVWYRHHLPHNIDRVADGLDPALLADKAEIVDGRGGDHPAPARRAARRRLRRINRAFADQHPGLLAAADDAVRRARRGLANAETAARRDWCFALYPPAKLAELRALLEESADEGCGKTPPAGTIRA
jgi:hypothetical protein